MLNGAFIVSSVGDILVLKTFLVSRHAWSPGTFYQRSKQDTSATTSCLRIDKVLYVYRMINDVYMVVVTEDGQSSPFMIYESLNELVCQCNDLIGEVNAENIYANVAMVYELIIQIYGTSFPSPVTQSGKALCKLIGESQKPKEKLFSSFLIDTLGLTSSGSERSRESTASKAPIWAGHKSASGTEIFIALIEYLTAIIDENGRVMRADIKGGISTKSYLPSPVEVHFTLSRKSGATDGAMETAQTHFLRAHPSSVIKEDEDRTDVKFLAEPGSCQVAEYHTHADSVGLPFTMYHNFSKRTKGNATELTLTCKLFCSLPPGHSPINWSATLPLPSKLVSVTGHSTLQGMKCSKNEGERSLSFFCPIFPARSHHSITIIMDLSQLPAYTPFEMARINLRFEVPNLCVSNMKIHGTKVQSATSATGVTVNKWLRCLSYSKDYQFHLKSDWM